MGMGFIFIYAITAEIEVEEDDWTGCRKFAGKTIIVSGASRGIGKEIALKLAKDGANIVVAAKTAKPHPKLPGTIFSAVEDIEKVFSDFLNVFCSQSNVA